MLSFNFYFDITFWLCFILIVLIFRLFNFSNNIRNIGLAFCSIAMLLALPMFDYFTLLFASLITIFTFIVGYYLINKNNFNKLQRIFISSSAIIILIFILSIFKYGKLQQSIAGYFLNVKPDTYHLIFILGISYFVFKMIHFVVDCYKKQISNLNFLNFFNYIFFFPSFISGPINRYNHFCEQLDFENTKSISQDLRPGIERVIHGLFKKIVLCTIIFPYAIININKPVSDLSIFELTYGLYAYAFYFYFDFSGYTDCAVGSARMMGIELPENFNNPFLKKNIQQLWASWHMSLTRLLTDYIYWPLSRKLRIIEYFKNHPVILSNVSIMVTFIACGAWHGETLNFILWGAYHGCGLSVLNIYQQRKRKLRSQTMRKYFLSKYSEWAGVFLTFNFFAFGLIFFSFDMKKIILLLSNMF